MKFVRDALSTFSAQIVTVLAAIVSSVVVARVLGPEGKGAYALVILVPTMLGLVGNLGIGQANAYFGATKKHEWRSLASNSLVSAPAIGLLLVAVFLVYFFLVHPSFLRDVEARCLLLGLLAVPFSLTTTYFSLILLGQGKIRLYNMVHVVPGVVGLVAVLVLLLIFGAGVFSVIVAWTSTVVIGSALSVVAAGGVGVMSRSFSLRLFWESVRFGFPVSLGNAIQYLNYRVDMIIVASLLDVTAVGYYSVAASMVEVLWYLPSAVGTILFARTTSSSAEEANSATPRICRNTVFVTAVSALALFVVSRYVVLLCFGSAFLPALKPLWILLPGVVALSLWKVLPNDLVARGRTAVMPIGAAVSLALNIPLNLLLIPRMGISGAALSSTISYTATGLVVLSVFLRVSKASWVDTLVIKREDLGMYATACGAMGRSLLSTIHPMVVVPDKAGRNRAGRKEDNH